MTSSRYADFLNEQLTTDTTALDYEMEPNPAIERTLRNPPRDARDKPRPTRSRKLPRHDSTATQR